MAGIKLQAQKKEIAKLDNKHLAEICIRLAKHKTENKELLNYLLFYSYDNEPYIEELKQDIEYTFENLPYGEYAIAVQLKKLILRLNKHLKFVALKDREAEIITEFCHKFIEHINIRSHYSPLIQVLYRQFIKLNKVVVKLNEDLQFDYQQHLNEILFVLKKSRFYTAWEVLQK
jgi:hypothetical protein